MSGPGSRGAGPKPSSRGCDNRAGKPFPRLLQRPADLGLAHALPPLRPAPVIASYLSGGGV